jgi:hypothetical protein
MNESVKLRLKVFQPITPRLLSLYHIEHVRSIDNNISEAVNEEHIIDIIVTGTVDHLLVDNDVEEENEGGRGQIHRCNCCW